METATFEKLCDILKTAWSTRERRGPTGISLKKALYLTIWKLANQCSFRDVGDRFNFGRGTTYRVFIKTTRLLANLKRQIIKFPSTEISQRKTMKLLEACRAHPFPFVLGCVDGTHIRIPQTSTGGKSYYNRKGTSSIVLQAVADRELFTDAFVGYPGRCHDALVWQNSPLKRAIVKKHYSLSTGRSPFG
ncbi:putative nuclease HARBI1 [Bactrocera tryoni]|uniref:putative nuclease HARBI1 n=1 Tax=Bactrocera tryoni TaxID=59916 RepID=UPI001A9732C5|nr:putative nuclease HARBI1 [Bactrocera tryoni]